MADGAMIPVCEPARDLVSVTGVFNDKHYLFRCEIVVLAGNIRTLLAEYERGRAALCQNLAIAYLRIKRGDIAISWQTWCQRFVLRADGKPYSHDTIEKWVKIGMRPDIEAAWKEHQDKQRETNKASEAQRLGRAEQKVVAYDRMQRILGPDMAASVAKIAAPSLCDRGLEKADRQFKILLAAWDAAHESVREKFLHHIGAQMTDMADAS